MILTQNKYEELVNEMSNKGVPHTAFEILADLRSNEINNSKEIDAIQFAIVVALKGFEDFEGKDVHVSNYLQVIRKLIADYCDVLDEIAESHSSEDVEVDGHMCYKVDCGCEFCRKWEKLNGDYSN